MKNRMTQLLTGGLVVAGIGMASVISAQPAAAAPATTGASSVNCGNIAPKGAKEVDLIAESHPAGRVGCDEAITVAADYFKNEGKSEGTERNLTVDGWSCGITAIKELACGKNGLGFHTTPTA